MQQFHDDSACAAYLEHLRWPDGFRCSACITRGDPWRQTRGLLVCPACSHQTSVTDGKKILFSSSDAPAHVSKAGMHRVASLLKRRIQRTNQESFVPGHLKAYLEEFTYRFNSRTSRRRGLIFRRLMEQARLPHRLLKLT